MDTSLLKFNLYRPPYPVVIPSVPPSPSSALPMASAITNNFQYFSPFFYRPGESFQAPLDLSFKVNESSPDTPPSTPSPQRKRSKIIDERLTDIDLDNRKANRKTPTTAAAGKYLRKFNQFSDTIYIDNKKYYNNSLNNFNHYFNNFKNAVAPNSVNEKDFTPPEDKTIERTGRGILFEENGIEKTTSDGVGEEDDFIDITGPDDDYYMLPKTKVDSNVVLEDSVSLDVETVPPTDTANDNPETDGEVPEVPTILEKGKGYFEDDKLHNQAIDGFAKLFEKNFGCKEDQSEAENSHLAFQAEIKTPTYKAERKRIKTRKQVNDEDNTSPVSGTIIKELKEGEEYVIRKGDIDPAFNLVEITEESKANLGKIFNRIGSYLCKLCNSLYEDAFCLAQHRCPRIVHIEYRCSECEKIFNSPANLASHKRWHKPRQATAAKKSSEDNADANSSRNSESASIAADDKPISDVEESYPCPDCGKVFRRIAYLKKHSTCHRPLSATPISPSDSSMLYDKSQVNPYAAQLRPPQPQLQHSYGGVSTNDYFGAIMSDYDKRKLQSFSEYYLQHQERLSAFQFVKNNPYEDYMKKKSCVDRFSPYPLHLDK